MSAPAPQPSAGTSAVEAHLLRSALVVLERVIAFGDDRELVQLETRPNAGTRTGNEALLDRAGGNRRANPMAAAPEPRPAACVNGADSPISARSLQPDG